MSNGNIHKNEVLNDFLTYTQCADVQIDLNRTIDNIKREQIFCDLSFENVLKTAISDFIDKITDIAENKIVYEKKQNKNLKP